VKKYVGINKSYF